MPVSRRDFLGAAALTAVAPTLVSATVIGMPKMEHIEQNVAVAKAFKPLPADEMKRMSGDLSARTSSRWTTTSAITSTAEPS